MKYSTEEQVIGEWIDGRPVYQKTMVVPIDRSKNETNYTHGISNLDQVISYSGFMQELYEGAVSNRFIPQFYYTGDSRYNVSLYSVRKTDMCLVYGKWLMEQALSVTEVYITLQYTKTTD